MPGKSDKPADPLSVLRKRIAAAATEPGVYRWLDAEGTVMYVGKAKNLRKRLQQYVQVGKKNMGPWKESFLRKVTDFEVTVCGSEVEALVLETNLIKELKPKYNVLMKDDKNYLYVRVTTEDPYPRIETVRKLYDRKSKHFGPYTSSDELRRTLEMLRRLYPYRTCKMEITPNSELRIANSELHDPNSQLEISNSQLPPGESKIRLEVTCTNKDRPTPCLDYHIQKCCAPCVGTVTPEEYRERTIDPVIAFLKGNRDPVKALLKEKMMAAAAEKRFEQAAELRNDLRLLEGKREEQIVSDTTGEDGDVIGVAVLSGRAHVVLMQRREGRIVGEHHFALMGVAESTSDILEQFLPQYYADVIDLPGTVLVGEEFAGREAMELWLTQKRERKVQIRVPERGRKSHLLQLAEKNAQERARSLEVKWESEERNRSDALAMLQELLKLPTPPMRIEGYDISHLGGTETVGSMVVMKNGKAANDQYRSFTIRTMRSGDIDDYRSLQEVLSRRFRRFTEDLPAEEERWNAKGITFGKAKKADAKRLTELLKEALPDTIDGEEAVTKEYLVARKDGDIIGFCRVVAHEKPALQELRCAWCDETQDKTLPIFLTRKLLRSVKKGKVYATIDAPRERDYGAIGFRHVITPPPAMQKRLDEVTAKHPKKEHLVVVWEASQNKVDPSLSARPDLLVIDGGKGQLSAVVEVMNERGVEIPVIGLAKREEEIFVPGSSDPIVFPKDSSAKFLLMRLRDEAHRFANRHREGRGLKTMKQSALDEIPGIGDATRNDLMKKFGSLDAIRVATDDELLAILTTAQLEAVRIYFTKDQ